MRVLVKSDVAQTGFRPVLEEAYQAIEIARAVCAFCAMISGASGVRRPPFTACDTLVVRAISRLRAGTMRKITRLPYQV